MKKQFLNWPIVMLMGVAVMFTSCDEDTITVTNPVAEKTIAGTASGDDDFSILVDALTRTGLVSVLDDASAEFTVFAPDNDAFTDLLADLQLNSLDELETALGNDGLKNVLLYHVLSGEVTAAMVSEGYVTMMGVNANGNMLSAYISLEGSDVVINAESDVETADIQASNGVIHQIDEVLLPPTVYDLIAFNDEDFNSLAIAVGAADGNLDMVLGDETAEYTVFAPNDDAFDAAITATSSGDLNGLVAAIGGTSGLQDVLLYHVLGSEVRASAVTTGMVPTANGDMLSIDTSNGVVITDGQNGMATVIKTNITGTNGVIHEITGVLLP